MRLRTVDSSYAGGHNYGQGRSFTRAKRIWGDMDCGTLYFDLNLGRGGEDSGGGFSGKTWCREVDNCTTLAPRDVFATARYKAQGDAEPNRG